MMAGGARPSGAGAAERRPVVLIVEDNETNLMLVRAVLNRDGLQTLAVRSAEEALSALRTSHPDLILTDVQLPGMDGWALVQHLKADPATAAIPVVALTAYAMPEDRARAMAAGCTGYLSKPVNTRTLARDLRALLYQRPPAERPPRTSELDHQEREP